MNLAQLKLNHSELLINDALDIDYKAMTDTQGDRFAGWFFEERYLDTASSL